MVFNVFGYSIDFVFRLMHFYLWICTRNRIYFSSLLLFFKDGSFSDTNGELNIMGVTLFSEEKTWGESILSLNLFLSIIISKSMSTFLPLAKL